MHEQDLSIFKNKCGVYKIELPDANICYIGSSKNIWKRLNQHLRELNRNKHYNTRLQQYWSPNYQLSLLEECDKSLLLSKEEEWIKKSNNCVSSFYYSDHIYLIDDYLKERLFAKIIKNDGCWIYAGKKRDGYGRIQSHGKTLLAHRVMYYLHYGNYPYFVRHTCNNRSCCNPDHLTIDSNLSNQYLSYKELENKFCEVYADLKGDKWKVIEVMKIGESTYHRLKLKYFRGRRFNEYQITAFNETKNLKQWSNDPRRGQNVTQKLILSRIRGGMSPEDAIHKDGKIKRRYDQSIEEAFGLFLCGFHMKHIIPPYRELVKNYEGRYILPSEPDKHTMLFLTNPHINIHIRLGKYYYVIDNKVSEEFYLLQECWSKLLSVTDDVRVRQEYDKINWWFPALAQTTHAENCTKHH